MKKIVLLIICLIALPITTYAKKHEIKLDKCIDGDTASFTIDKEVKKVRFLAIDSPEIDNEEPYSIEAREFTCNLLTNAKKIYLEYDNNADKEDKYERLLAWVWVDDKLIQKEIIANGYAKIRYLYDEYKYTNDLKEVQRKVKEQKINIWSLEENQNQKEETVNKKSKKDIILKRIEESYNYIVVIIAMILALITFYKRNKKKNKLRK